MAATKKALRKDALTDSECDFVIQRVLWALRDAVRPTEFFRETGRPIVFEVAEVDRERARSLVRLFARSE